MGSERGSELIQPQTMGEVLALLIHRSGLNMKELAEKAGVHRNTIRAILRDRLVADPERETVAALAQVLGVDPDVLWSKRDRGGRGTPDVSENGDPTRSDASEGEAVVEDAEAERKMRGEGKGKGYRKA